MLEVDSAVNDAQLIGGTCDAGAALSRCKTSLFPTGVTKGIARVLVVLMAGKSSDELLAPTESLANVGVKIIAVGMGGFFDRSQLSEMAFSDSYVLTADLLAALPSVSGSISTLISQGSLLFAVIYN